MFSDGVRRRESFRWESVRHSKVKKIFIFLLQSRFFLGLQCRPAASRECDAGAPAIEMEHGISKVGVLMRCILPCREAVIGLVMSGLSHQSSEVWMR